MLKVFLVVYAAGGIGAVAETKKDLCEDSLTRWSSPRFSHYTLKCEEHAKPPKVTVKIPDRKRFESKCKNLVAYAHCLDLPNGDVKILGGCPTPNKCYSQIIKAKDLK